MNKTKKILILGGGQAAAYASKEIRSIDTDSDVTIIVRKNIYHMKDLLCLKIIF